MHTHGARQEYSLRGEIPVPRKKRIWYTEPLCVRHSYVWSLRWIIQRRDVALIYKWMVWCATSYVNLWHKRHANRNQRRCTINAYLVMNFTKMRRFRPLSMRSRRVASNLWWHCKSEFMSVGHCFGGWTHYFGPWWDKIWSGFTPLFFQTLNNFKRRVTFSQ